MEKEVTREEFKALFFKHATPDSGWTHASWEGIGKNPDGNKKYFYRPPATPQDDRMFIGNGNDMCRMYFLTSESEERFFDHPGRD